MNIRQFFLPLFLGAGLITVQPCVGASGGFTSTGSLVTARYDHTTTLLPNGKVLVTGGIDNTGSHVASAELYDPASGTWTATGSLSVRRYDHTATLLPNGKVLVVGGQIGADSASAELYDPATGSWTVTGSLGTGRGIHTATLLPSGKVLVAGGVNGTLGPLANAELYDPASGTWTATGSMGAIHYGHTATLLPNGEVLVVGGSGAVTLTELYDSVSGTWRATGSLATERFNHTATLLSNGYVLVAGGGDGSAPLGSAELYDPVSGTWTVTGNLWTRRAAHTATLLPDGRTLLSGGAGSSNLLASAELYNPATGTWTVAGSLGTARYIHTATLLANGKVLTTGGGGNSSNALASTELYDPAQTTTPTPTPTPSNDVGNFRNTGSLTTGRFYHTATLLPNGKVLAAGGWGVSQTTPLASAELYDPASATWAMTSTLGSRRGNHTATMLPSGKVLVAGGYSSGTGNSASAELYDPASAAWASTGSLNSARSRHTATLLSNGKVLVVGGLSGGSSSTSLASAELYDPASGTWTVTGSLAAARYYHAATLLPNGKVLVTGGDNVLSAEVYDPASGTWTGTQPLPGVRAVHTATLLPNGNVLITGGSYSPGFGGALASSELYVPASGTWTAAGNLGAARYRHTATLLTNGRVLATGGLDNSSTLASAEVYDPAGGSWRATGGLGAARQLHTATLLPNGEVLVAGGYGGSGAGGPLTSTELYLTVPPTRLGNISTRLRVETGDNVLIAGFIVGGTQPKKIIVRAIGPSLPLTGPLADPILELRDSSGGLIASNDNWRSDQAAEIITAGLPPANDLESAIVATLPGNGAYTAIVRGVNNGTGMGVVEAYDLDGAVDSRLANISTRGLVQTGDNVLIAGTIVLGEVSQRVLIRAIGPSLNLAGKLADPTLEFRDGNGGLILSNDNWRSNQEAEIMATMIPPSNDLESAIVASLPAGGAAYTAIVRGANGATGVAVVEVYALD